MALLRHELSIIKVIKAAKQLGRLVAILAEGLFPKKKNKNKK